MNIYEKLNEARVRLQTMNLKKSGNNAFAEFKYYELSDFLPKINEIFAELKLCSILCLYKENATLTIVNGESPSEHIEFESPIADAALRKGSPIQSLGATHTYIKRYLYMNALEIIEHDVLDATLGKETKDSKTIFSIGEGGLTLDINTIDCQAKLNNAYKLLVEALPEDASWKKPLMNKANELKCVFNKDDGYFVRLPK